MADIELKPCPFCGCAGVEIECTSSGVASAVCKRSRGGCGAASGWQGSRESAAATWNRRATAAAGTEPAKPADPSPELERTCPDCKGIRQPFRACAKCVDRGKIPTEDALKLALRCGWKIDLQRRLYWTWPPHDSGYYRVEIDNVLAPLNLVDVMRSLGQIGDEAARRTGPDKSGGTTGATGEVADPDSEKTEAPVREIPSEQYEPCDDGWVQTVTVEPDGTRERRIVLLPAQGVEVEFECAPLLGPSRIVRGTRQGDDFITSHGRSFHCGHAVRWREIPAPQPERAAPPPAPPAIELLLAHLRKYGDHAGFCAVGPEGSSPVLKCTCGWDEIRAELEVERE